MLTNTPNGREEIERVFGKLEREDFEARYVVPFALPYPLIYSGVEVTRARCHQLVVENFQAAFEAIQKAGLQDKARHYGGIYAARNIRGASHPSTHSWGIAIDLEPDYYPLGSVQRFPAAIVQAFKDAGFFYGGDFQGRKDPMHFQFATGY